MKKLLLLASAFVFSVSLFAQTKVDDVAKFNSEKHDFGKIKQGVPAVYYFEITNSSDKPLVIESASASCGCTVPDYPKEPIAAGATSKIKVQYNAAAMGHFDKDVYIKLAGISDQKTLKISGEVVTEQATQNSLTNVPNSTAAPITSQQAVTNSNTNSQAKTVKPKTTTKSKTTKTKSS